MTQEETKKRLIEQTTIQFTKLTDENKQFILGYMLGVQAEQQKAQTQPRTA